VSAPNFEEAAAEVAIFNWGSRYIPLSSHDKFTALVSDLRNAARREGARQSEVAAQEEKDEAQRRAT
jgi:hypothetical protein